MFNIAFFQQFSLGERFLWFVGLSVAGWILSKLLVLVWEKLILPLASKTQSSLDDHLAKNLHKPVIRLLILGSIYLAAKFTLLTAEQVKIYVAAAENLIYLILILFVASLLNNILKSIIDWYLQDMASKTESTLDDTIFPLFRKAGAVIIYFIASTVILDKFNVNLTGFLATAGVASLALAFAAQETLSNVIAGISILLDHSYHIGDRIELKDGLVGDVSEIGLRSTKILSLDQRLIIVPNKDIAGSRLINWCQPNAATNIKLKIGVAMDEDLEKVKRVVTEVCNQEASLSRKAPAAVVCTGFGPYFIELLVVATVDDCRTTGTATDHLVVKIQEAFQREKIRLPYPLQQIQMQKVG
ncbi:MAG TPA: mechanosensitive ion channel family protein [Bacillota bacterium]